MLRARAARRRRPRPPLPGLGPLAPSRDQPGASASQAPPRVVGAGLRRYVVGRCLGRGASGVVHEGVDQATGERVAVKEIELTNLVRKPLPVSHRASL